MEYVNPFHSEVLSDYLIKKLMPIFPLWSSILVDLSRHNVASNVQEQVIFLENITKTNSIIENRFRILKYIFLNDRSQHRIDEFSELLKDQTVFIQLFAVSESLQSRIRTVKGRLRTFPEIEAFDSLVKRNRNKPPKKSMLLQENWDKQPHNLKSKVGKYQQLPKYEFTKLDRTTDCALFTERCHVNENKSSQKYQSVDSKMDLNNPRNSTSLETKKVKIINMFWRLRNFGNSCWFNSMVQAFLCSNISTQSIEHFSAESNVVDLVQSPKLDKSAKSVVQLWNYMVSNECCGKRIPEHML